MSTLIVIVLCTSTSTGSGDNNIKKNSKVHSKSPIAGSCFRDKWENEQKWTAGNNNLLGNNEVLDEAEKPGQTGAVTVSTFMKWWCSKFKARLGCLRS